MKSEARLISRKADKLNSFKIKLFDLSTVQLFNCFCLIFLFSFFSQKVLAKTPKVYTAVDQYKYEQKALRAQEIEKYKRSLLPESGCMTREEYERKSLDIPNDDRKIPPPALVRDIKMKYVPQPIYKLGLYNNPPGSAELHLSRKFKYNRQENGGAITSPNKDLLVYPVVYYYVTGQCTGGDLFVIPLDKSLPDIERIQRANVVKRISTPILSTEKDVQVKSTFRSMTPVDFSPDGTLLIAKEKIGNEFDGIWKTNLWVYDFTTQQARQIPEVREAIKFYWLNATGTALDDKRWDILPLGFSADNPQRIIVSAYGWTGEKPKFLGNWSVDAKGERTELVSLFEPNANIAVSGYKLVKDGYVNPVEVMNNEKAKDKAIKMKRKAAKKAVKQDKKKKKAALKKTLKEMKHEENSAIKNLGKNTNKSGVTGVD